jgi:hypothetical protein
MLVAATTLAALLAATPSSTALDRLAANGGFLLGNAHRCGIATDRVVRAGEVVQNLIAAAAADDNERSQAVSRFAKFFLVSAVPDSDREKLVAACDRVKSEFTKFERHEQLLVAKSTKSAPANMQGDTVGRRYDPGAGE